MQRMIWLVWGLGAIAAWGCGDDDDGDDVTLSDLKLLKDLTTSETEELCREKTDFTTAGQVAALKIQCTLEGKLSGTMCESVRASCIKEGVPAPVNDSECQSIREACPEITVGEARQCMSAAVELVNQIASEFTCTSINPLSTNVPPACSKLGERCPELAHFGSGT